MVFVTSTTMYAGYLMVWRFINMGTLTGLLNMRPDDLRDGRRSRFILLWAVNRWILVFARRDSSSEPGDASWTCLFNAESVASQSPGSRQRTLG